MTSAVIFPYAELICFAGGGINKSEVNICNVSRSEMPRKSCHGHGSTEETAASNILLYSATRLPSFSHSFFHFFGQDPDLLQLAGYKFARGQAEALSAPR